MSRSPFAPVPISKPATQRAAPVAAPFVSRPRFLDYFLMFCGVGLSLWLAELSGFQAQPTASTPPEIPLTALKLLPLLLFLPLGVVLFWPVFYTTQRIFGRPLSLTAGEWLWGVSWLITVALTTWIVWQGMGTPPEALQPAAAKGYAFVGYAVASMSLAAIAVLLFLVDLIGRWTQPWTHQLSLVLALWPVLPLIALLVWKIELK